MLTLRRVLLAVAITAASVPSYSQLYPARPLRIIVPNAPGSSGDIVARLIASPLAERLGQPVIVDNRAGAGTMIGGEAVARAAPDGYTLVPGYESVQWLGLLAPAGVSREIVARLYKESLSVLRSPAITERLTKDGADVVASAPEEFGAYIRSETAKWAKVLKSAGIQPE